jgi:hypothetical protein
MSAHTIGLLSLRQIVLVRWTTSVSVADVEALRRASSELAATHPGGIGHLNLVDTPEAMKNELEDDAREAIVALLRDRTTLLRLSSVIIPHEGFQASVVRAIVGGLLLVSRTAAHVRVHASVRQGAEWLTAGLRGLRGEAPPSVEDLEAAMAELRKGPRGA